MNPYDLVLKTNTEIILEEYIVRMTASGLKLAAMQTTCPNASLPQTEVSNSNVEVIEIEDEAEGELEELEERECVSDECRPETPVVCYGDCGILDANGTLSQVRERSVTPNGDKIPASPLLVPIKYVDYELDKILYLTPSAKPRGRPRKNPVVVKYNL